MPHYSLTQIAKALETYHDLRSVARTVQRLGYPTRSRLYAWIREEVRPRGGKRKHGRRNTPEHPWRPPANVKLEAIRRCFETGEKVADVAEETGCSTASLYRWRRLYLSKGALALQDGNRDVPRGPLGADRGDTFPEDAESLRARIRDLEMDVAILKEALNLIKKDPGVDVSSLRNREKTEIVNALKGRFGLGPMLAKTGLSRSVYYYATAHAGDRMEKDRESLEAVAESFRKSKGRYGYRRIHSDLKAGGTVMSEKVIRRLMRRNGLSVHRPGRRRYSSYKGEITPAVPNLLNRDFHADRPNEKWLTDITEFALSDGKLYLSPMIDCFDGRPVCWTIGERPDARLVNRMLDEAVASLRDGEKPVVHTDRGCHYRWPGWIDRMRKAGLARSMSRKGCSPDNSACEGFFGITKNETFYNRDLAGVTRKEFRKELDDYLKWFRSDRIKMNLGGMSPDNYRKSLNLI